MMVITTGDITVAIGIVIITIAGTGDVIIGIIMTDEIITTGTGVDQMNIMITGGVVMCRLDTGMAGGVLMMVAMITDHSWIKGLIA